MPLNATTNNIWHSIVATGKSSHAPYVAIMHAAGVPGMASLRAKANAFTAANAVSGAAPNNNTLAQYNQNTPPGQFGAFPQNNAKPIPGGPRNSSLNRTQSNNHKRRD